MKTTLFSLLIMIIASMPSFAAINPGNTKLNSVQLPFIENQGQLGKGILYYTTTRNGTLLVDDAGKEYFVLRLKDDKSRLVVSEQFVGAKNINPIGVKQAKTRINRYIGNDPDKWQENIPTWNEISIKELYASIDYQLRPLAEGAEKIFIVKPGADPEQIRLKVDGIEKLSMGKDGSLKLQTAAGNLEFTSPIAYQELDDKRTNVTVSYTVKNNTYGFKLGAYDKTHILYIDPLVRATFFGGSNQDYGYDIAVNQASGSVYITGYTNSIDIPTTTGVFQETKPGSEYDNDLYIAKFNGDLSELEAATYYGSTGWEYGVAGLALHPDGSVYITGKTQGTDLPGSSNGYQNTHAGAGDAFVAHLNADLSGPPQATYFGGTAEESGISITVNANAGQDLYGSVYLVGRTSSTDLPGTAGGLIETNQGGGSDVFVAYFDPTLQTLGQATYFGGSGTEEPASFTRGQASFVHPRLGYLCLVGWTSSPTMNYVFGGVNGTTDAFFGALYPHLDNATMGLYIGGPNEDYASAVAFKEEGATEEQIYIVGRTKSVYDPLNPNRNLVLPEHNGFQTDYQGGNFDGFVVGLNNNFAPNRSTYLGGSLDDRGYGITVNPETETVWVTGETSSTDFPYVGADQGSNAGYIDAFVTGFSPDLSSLNYSAYLGGISSDYGTAMGVHRASNRIYTVGNTSSADLYGTDGLAYDNSYNEAGDAFIALHEEKVLKSWIRNTVTLQGNNPDLAVDSADNLYACYFNDVNAYMVKRNVATGNWSTLHEFALPPDDLGFDDCAIAVDDGGSPHACIVTRPANISEWYSNDLWYMGPSTGTGVEPVDSNEPEFYGAEGTCSIALHNNIPTIAYRLEDARNESTRFLAAAVKPDPYSSWIVMDNIYLNPDGSIHWGYHQYFADSIAIAIDSSGIPMIEATDDDETASFFMPDDYPPLTPSMAELITWTRIPSDVNGAPINLHYISTANGWRRDRAFETRENNAISTVTIDTDTETFEQNIFRLFSPEFADLGVSDSTGRASMLASFIAQNGNSTYYVPTILGVINLVFSGVNYIDMFIHATEDIAESVSNCALAKYSADAHVLCEDGNGNLVYFRQEYPASGYLSVAPRNWKFGQERWDMYGDIIKEWRAFYLTNLGGSALAIRDVRIESDGDVTPWVLDLSCANNFALDTNYDPGDYTAVCVRPDPAAYVLDTITARLVVETDEQTIVSYLEASPIIGEDTDSDGIPDQEEYGPDGDNPLFDGNGDGIPDSEQSNAVSFASNVLDDGTLAGYITLSTIEEHSFHNVGEIVSTTSLPLNSGLPLWGAFSFELELYCIIPSACSTTVQIDFHQTELGLDVFPDTYFKSGPTLPDGDHDTYLFHLDETGTGATFFPNDKRIILYFTDGQRGDHDLVINNQISDPGLPTVSYVDVLGALKQEVLAAALPENLERTLVRYVDQSIKAVEANKTSSVERVTRNLSKLVTAVQEEAGLVIPQETADKWINIAQMIIDQLNTPVAANQ